MKNLYRGAFNFGHVLRIEYAYAHSKRQAWAVMCKRIAKKDGVPDSSVMGLFDGSKPNHEITVEMEVSESNA